MSGRGSLWLVDVGVDLVADDGLPAEGEPHIAADLADPNGFPGRTLSPWFAQPLTSQRPHVGRRRPSVPCTRRGSPVVRASSSPSYRRSRARTSRRPLGADTVEDDASSEPPPSRCGVPARSRVAATARISFNEPSGSYRRCKPPWTTSVLVCARCLWRTICWLDSNLIRKSTTLLSTSTSHIASKKYLNSPSGNQRTLRSSNAIASSPFVSIHFKYLKGPGTCNTTEARPEDLNRGHHDYEQAASATAPSSDVPVPSRSNRSHHLVEAMPGIAHVICSAASAGASFGTWKLRRTPDSLDFDPTPPPGAHSCREASRKK